MPTLRNIFFEKSAYHAFDLAYDAVKSSYRAIKITVKAIHGLLKPVSCIFDDIPLLFVKGSPTLKKVDLPNDFGLFAMVGMGYFVFLMELIEGIAHLRKALAMKEEDESRRTLIALSVAKILFALLGFAVSTVVLGLTLAGISMLASIFSIGVPAMVAIIVGVELGEKVHGLWQAKDKKTETNARRKVVFGSIAFGLAVVITGLATLSVLSGLSVVSLGIAPAAVLISVVLLAVAIKVFELIDKKMDYKMTNGIKRLFGCMDENDPSPESKLTDVLLNEKISHLKPGDQTKTEEELTEISLEEKKDQSTLQSKDSVSDIILTTKLDEKVEKLDEPERSWILCNIF